MGPSDYFHRAHQGDHSLEYCIAWSELTAGLSCRFLLCILQNPRYNFWNRSFIRCAPEIEKLFESVARSCGGLKPMDDSMVSGWVSESAHWPFLTSLSDFGAGAPWSFQITHYSATGLFWPHFENPNLYLILPSWIICTWMSLDSFVAVAIFFLM